MADSKSRIASVSETLTGVISTLETEQNLKKVNMA